MIRSDYSCDVAVDDLEYPFYIAPYHSGVDDFDYDITLLGDTPVCVKYPSLVKFIEESNMTFAQFTMSCGIPFPTFWKFLYGKADIGKRYIDRILMVTDMSYSECFRECKCSTWKAHLESRFQIVN